MCLQVPLGLLWQAMQPVDPVTGKSRGWLEIRADRDRSSIMFVLDTDSRSVHSSLLAPPALSFLLS